MPPADIGHRAFFGDAERDFALTTAMIVELERSTKAGIGALFARLMAKQFYLTDVAETIRLGLIGGGSDPLEAHALVAAYVADRPFTETFPLALAILEALWFGKSRGQA